MKRILFVAIFLLFGINTVYALDIVYPKRSGVIINSPSTFFVGSANPDLKLTVNNVNVNKSFWHIYNQIDIFFLL